MKLLILLLVLLLVAGVAVVFTADQADAHSPGCTYAFIYPYLYVSRTYQGQVFLSGQGPYHYYKYKYVSVSTNATHTHNCYFLVGQTSA